MRKLFASGEFCGRSCGESARDVDVGKLFSYVFMNLCVACNAQMKVFLFVIKWYFFCFGSFIA